MDVVLKMLITGLVKYIESHPEAVEAIIEDLVQKAIEKIKTERATKS